MIVDTQLRLANRRPLPRDRLHLARGALADEYEHARHSEAAVRGVLFACCMHVYGPIGLLSLSFPFLLSFPDAGVSSWPFACLHSGWFISGRGVAWRWFFLSHFFSLALLLHSSFPLSCDTRSYFSFP